MVEAIGQSATALKGDRPWLSFWSGRTAGGWPPRVVVEVDRTTGRPRPAVMARAFPVRGLGPRQVTRSVDLLMFGPTCLAATILVATFVRLMISTAAVAVVTVTTIGATVALVTAIRGVMLPGSTMVIATPRVSMLRSMDRLVVNRFSMAFEEASVATLSLGPLWAFGAARGVAPRGDTSGRPIAVENLSIPMIVDALMAQSDRCLGHCLMCSDVIRDRGVALDGCLG